MDPTLRFLRQTHVPIRVTLFLDGLDEIDGQHENIIRMIRNLAGLNNVKTCLSSRPLQVFEEAFRAEPGLRLQDLTSPGIRAYADIQLSDLVQRRILHNTRDEDRVGQLVGTIVSRAGGVFLWAVIAVRDVRGGLQDMVDLDELTQAIDNLPSELESLFMQILRRIKPAYQRDAARFLQIALHFDSRDLCLSQCHLNLCSLHLINSQRELADALFFYERVSPAKVIDACKTVQTQLLSHTTGLLELNPTTKTNDLLTSQEPLLTLEVNFLHRSAREFLLQNEEARLFLARQGFAKGQVHVAIARGILALIVQFSEREGPEDAYVCFSMALQHIAIAERMLGAAQSHLMRSLVDTFPVQVFTRVSITPPYLTTVTKSDEGKVSYKKSLDVVGMAAAEDLTLFICENLGILKLPGDDITILPNRNSYSPVYATLEWLRPIQSRDANKDQTMQKLSSNYRQALAGSLRMDLDVDHQLDRAICSPVEELGTQKSLNRAEHALAETHLLRCCNPSSYDVLRSLLHAGANPMAEMDPEHPLVYNTTANFWESWLVFLQRSHSDYLKTRKGPSIERYSRLNPTPEVTFNVTKALIAHGADVNMQLRDSRSTSCRCYLKRRELRGCLFDIAVDATAMFVLAECFSKEPEFLKFATEMKSVVFTPVRRLLFIDPLYDSPARGGSYLPPDSLPHVTVDPEDCKLLWPLMEEWENSGREGDLMALESELGKIWRAQQICTSAEDEILSTADLVMKMADKQREENMKRYCGII